MQKIKELLKEMTKDALSEESLDKLCEAIEAKAQAKGEAGFSLKLEAALAKQDAQYANKLEQLIEAIDTDHSNKLEKIVEGLENKHCGMLSNIVKKYKTEYLNECKSFKNDLVTKVDKYFDIVVESQIPQVELQEAVENTRSRKMLAEIGRMIGIDKLQQNDLVREGLKEAKDHISTLSEQVNTLKKEKTSLISEKGNVKRDNLLEEKCVGLPKVKKDYARNLLGNKSSQFITENFDLTIKMFDQEEATSSKRIVKEAKKTSKVISEDIDRAEKVIVESASAPEHADQYMDVLGEF